MNPPVINLGADTTLCEGQSIQLSVGNNLPNPSTYIWSTGSAGPTLQVDLAGTYAVNVLSYYSTGGTFSHPACSVSDTVVVTYRQKPRFNLKPDKIFCKGAGVWLDPQFNDTSFLWQDGSTANKYFANQPGKYYATATNSCGVYSDTVNVKVIEPPVVDLGPDTTLCANAGLRLNAGSSNGTNQYLWSNNSTDTSILVNKAGVYWVKVMIAGCTASDTVQINYARNPQFTLGPDRTICKGEKLILQPNLTNVNYLWQDGSTKPSFTATKPGVYSLRATNNCGAAVDSVLIAPGICELLMPTAFTPNNDGKNDLFQIPPAINLMLENFSVYNRWGEKIFSTDNVSKGWDGRVSGMPAPAGVYVYFIRAVLSNKEIVATNTFVLIH